MPWFWIAAFWLTAAVFVYAQVGYPLLLRLIMRWSRETGSTPQGVVELPTITLVIPAHNEEQVIGPKVENSLAVDYPRERLQILVASDGSSDHTVTVARSFEKREVKVLAFHQRRGKPPC